MKKFIGGNGVGGNVAGYGQQNLLTFGRTWIASIVRGYLITPPAIQEFWELSNFRIWFRGNCCVSSIPPTYH